MSFDVETQIDHFTRKLRGWPSASSSLEDTLRELLTVTDARAIGLWHIAGETLRLDGFAAKPDMSLEVQEGFASATETVSLTQTGLGIVSAVVHRKPMVAHVEPGPDGLVDSASWLVKFESVQSLSTPIFQGETILGVLAVSTAKPFEENDDFWRLLTGIGSRLSGD